MDSDQANEQDMSFEKVLKEMNKDLREDVVKIKMAGEEGKNKDRMIMATWNVRGTFVAGGLKELVKEVKKYNIDIIALQETKQLGSEIIEVEDVAFFKSGGKDRRFGIGFMVQKKFKERVMTFNPISERLGSIRLKGKKRNISIINVHAPSEDKEEEDKDRFYEQLVNEYERLPKHDIKIVIGDCNAKVGKEDMYRTTIGKHSKHEESNDNGQRIISFAMERNMVISSTQIQRKEIYKGTWVSPDGKTTNQIDHVLIEKRHRNLITNVRTMRGAEYNSDHFLVKITCKKSLEERERNKIRNKSIRHFDIENLKDEKIKKKYKEEINECLQKYEEKSQIDEIWEETKGVIMGANRAVIPRKIKQIETNDWFDEECKKIAEIKRKVRQLMLADNRERNIQKYKEIRKDMKRVCRKKKREYNENKLKEIEERFQNKEIRSFYQEVKKMEKGYQSKSSYIKTEEGILVCEPRKVVERWKTHFQELLNSDENEEQNVIQTIENDGVIIERPTEEEVNTIIKELKNNKCPGDSEITAEMLKAGGEQLHRKLYELIKMIWEREKMPEDWSKALVCPLYKKGDKLLCKNYRGIALLETCYKILAQILRRRLNNHSEEIIGEYQAGFRNNRSVTDHIFTLKEIQTTCYEYKVVLYALFMDFRQAYDKIDREKMYQAMSGLGVPSKLIRLVKMTLDKTRNEIVWRGCKSEEFEVKRGLRQGDPLSTVLFNLVLEAIIRNSRIKTEGTIFNNEHQCLAFADDLVMITKSKKELLRTTRMLEKEAGRFGLEINQEKTKYMVMGETQQETEDHLTLLTNGGRTYNFNRVSTFLYLGVLIEERGHEEQELKARIAKGNKKYGMLLSLMRSKYVSRKTKIRIYTTVIRPTVTYASETWVLKRTEEEMLERWERKMLRAIYGGIITVDGWRRRTNRELEVLYGEPSITIFIKAQRIRWRGHVERLLGKRMSKMILYRRPIGKRRKGRPRKRWEASVQEDIQSIGIRDWREKAGNRREWREVVRQYMRGKRLP